MDRSYSHTRSVARIDLGGDEKSQRKVMITIYEAKHRRLRIVFISRNDDERQRQGDMEITTNKSLYANL